MRRRVAAAVAACCALHGAVVMVALVGLAAGWHAVAVVAAVAVPLTVMARARRHDAVGG